MAKRQVRFTRMHATLLRKNDQLKDMVLGHMAQDIEVDIKTGGITPVKTGDMKAEVRHYKDASGHYIVEAPKEYSEVQEAGIRKTGPGAPTRRFNNYTTAGTGSGWFKHAIDTVTKHGNQYVKEAARALRI